MEAKLEKTLVNVMNLMGNAGSQGEAEAAAAAFQRLLMSHNIEEAEARKLHGRESDFGFVITEYRFAVDRTPGVTWRRSLLNTLCHFNFCRFLNISHKGGLCRIYGERGNTAAVIAMFERMCPVFERLANSSYDEHYADIPRSMRDSIAKAGAISSRRAWRGSFLIGVPSGLYARLQEERDAEKRDIPGASALVLANDAALQTFVDEKVGKTTNIGQNHDIDASAWRAGYKTGHDYRDAAPIGRRATLELVG